MYIVFLQIPNFEKLREMKTILVVAAKASKKSIQKQILLIAVSSPH
jgi:hypothetical protein